MLVQPYLFFEGRCEEALEFYRTKIGAQIKMMMRNKENPEPNPEMCSPGSEEKILHACFSVGDNDIMVSDGRATGKPSFQGFSLSITVSSDAEVQRLFTALSEGGQVVMPVMKTFYAHSFGMVTDRFGVMWMVINPVPMKH